VEEGIAFARGELNLRTTTLPDQPPQLRAKDVRRLRQRLLMSQSVFARMLNVSLKRVQSWEQGDRKPSHAALRLLKTVGANPAFVSRVAGVRSHLRRKKVAQALHA